MKKNILILVLTLISFSSFSQTIYSLNVSPNGTDTVHVNLEVVETQYINFIDYYYEFIGNEINLKVCYEFAPLNVAPLLSNTFNIPISSPHSYTLNIEIYRTEISSICDYTDLTDTATLQFSTPLTETVYLGIEDFEVLEKQINVYPNPAKDFLNITISNTITVNSLEIYNILGSKIKNISSNFELIDVSVFNNGMYFLKFNTSKGILQKKILVNN